MKMMEIIIGERVINKLKQAGTIISFDGKKITVQYKDRVCQLQSDAFEKGFIKYENAELQSKIDDRANAIKNKAEQEAEEKRIAKQNAADACRKMESMAPAGVRFNSVSIRLDSAPAGFSSVKAKYRKLAEEIFDKCDKDIGVLYDAFDPKMKYIAPPPATPRYYYIYGREYEREERLQYFRSRYAVGFLVKYGEAHVLRVISRNDVYTPGKYGGFTVTNSDTTEILRILCIDGEAYYFSKHLTCDYNNYKNTTLYNKWQKASYVEFVSLDDVIKMCDCGYLNEYIGTKNVNCLGYVKLLMSALYDNKAEIVFKHGLFSSISDIDNISEYLKEFSTKQIDFASKNNVINTLPVIKECGLYDVNILKNVETLMRKGRNRTSIYNNLKQLFLQRSWDVSVLNKKLVSFLRKNEMFNPIIYGEYVSEIARNPQSTKDDVFDKNYVERHFEMMQEKRVYYTRATENQYTQAAAELSWIDREENDYYIIVPKSIEEFKYEGQTQHICVYSMEYFLCVINQESIIVFLRKSKEVPYVTIEFDYNTFEVRQAYGKYNSYLDDELYEYIVDLGKRLYDERRSYE